MSQSIDQMVEHQPNAPRHLQVLVHRQPHLQFEIDILRQQPRQCRNTGGQPGLATADADTGAQGGKLGQVRITAEAK
jgi:hypothetical protein